MREVTLNVSIIGALRAELPDLVRQIVREELAAQQADAAAPPARPAETTSTGYATHGEDTHGAPADGPETDEPAPAGTTGPVFDPDAHNVADVRTYLEGLEEAGNVAERDRVLAVERAGQARKGILGT